MIPAVFKGSRLRSGFQVVRVGNTAAQTTSTLRYAPGAARTMPMLKAAIKTITSQQSNVASSGVLDLIIGTEWAGLTSSGTVPTDVGGLRGNTDICKDKH